MLLPPGIYEKHLCQTAKFLLSAKSSLTGVPGISTKGLLGLHPRKGSASAVACFTDPLYQFL